MRRLSVSIILILLTMTLLLADEISIMSPSRAYALSGDSEDEDYVVSFDGEQWSLVATRSNVDGVRLRGASRVRSQSLLSLTVIEESSGRILTLNSNVADDVSYEVAGSYVELMYSFEEGIAVPLRLEVSDDGLHVSIDTSGIIESDDMFITNIQLLPFFSDSSSRSSGYFLIPDGEGALLTFNNGIGGIYRQQVYSRDSVDSTEVRTTEREVIRLPLFGVERDGQDVIAVATQGAGMATLNAQSSSESNPYNQCFFSYQLRRSEDQSIAEDAFQTVWENPRLFSGVIELVIVPVDRGEGADSVSGYVAMAHTFRDMFIEDNGRKVGLVLDVDVLDLEPFDIGGIPTPFNVVEPDADEAIVEEMLERLQHHESGMLLNFVDWNKDQMEMKASSDLKWNGFPLSSRKRESAFAAIVDAGNVITAAYDPVSLASRSGDAIRNLSDEVVAQYGYKVNSSYRDVSSRYYLRNAEVVDLDLFADEPFLPAYSTIGEISYSDYGEDHPLDKDSYCLVMAEKLASLKHPYAVYGGNLYALDGAFHVFEAPYRNSRFEMLDTAVPFYEIALSGRLTYSFDPVDRVADSRLMLLKILETGAVPCIRIDGDSDSDFICSFLEEHLDEISMCAGQGIRDHIIDGSKRIVEYDNGVVITIDYADGTYDIGGGRA